MTSLKTKEIRVRDIFVDPDLNCRTDFTTFSVKTLAESIKREGLRIPIIVRRHTGTEKWILVAGHRRLKAVVNILGWSTIWSVIHGSMTSEEAKALNLTENFEREDLTLLEEAARIRELYGDISDTAMALKVGRPRTWVKIRRLALALPEEVKKFVAVKLLSNNDIIILSETKDEDQLRVAESMVRSRRKGLGPVMKLRRVGRRPQNRKDIHTMITAISERYGMGEISRIAAFVLAWTANNLDDEELFEKLDAF